MKFYSPHGVARETLASGAPLPEGDFFDLTREESEEPHNSRLIQEGKILPVTKTAVKLTESVKDKEAGNAS